MKKIVFSILPLITFSMHSMQNPGLTDSILKWTLIRFINNTDETGVYHLLDNGAAHIVDQDVSTAATTTYNAYRQRTKNPTINSPAGNIYCCIEKLFNPSGPKVYACKKDK